MRGYHYTTRDRWEQIKYLGLYPNEISAWELEKFRGGMPTMPSRAVWVWKERLTPDQVWICTTLLADRHGSFDLVLLEVEYDNVNSVSRICRPHPDDSITLTCGFCVGRFETGQLGVELLIDFIPASQITLIEELNLLEPFGELCLL